MADTSSSNADTQYAQKAIETYIDKLKRSTRFEVDNITIHETRIYKTHTHFIAGFSLDTRIDTNTYKGIISSESNDMIEHNDTEEYNKNIKKILESEYSRSDTFDECIERFAPIPFGSLSEEQYVRRHPSRILHFYTCGRCNGEKKLTCGQCSGQGTSTCGKCNGQGECTCESCGGRKKMSCRRCGGTGTMKRNELFDIAGDKKSAYTQCDQCYGQGIVSCSTCRERGIVTCSKCNGGGILTCNNCNGSGKVICSTCDGHGNLTDVCVINTYAIPSYSVKYLIDALSYLQEVIEVKIGLKNFVNHGEIIFDEYATERVDRHLDLQYDAYLMVCEIDIQINDLRTSIVIFGKDYTLFDAGGVMGELLKEDLEVLGKLTQENIRLSYQYKQKIETGISTFMESEIHQEMMEEMNKSIGIVQVYENLGRSLSKEHLEAAKTSLEYLLRNLAKKINCEGGILIVLTSLLWLILFFSVGNPASDRYDFFGIELVNKTLTQILMGGAFLILVIEWIIEKRWVKKIGGVRLVKFSRMATSNLSFLNVLIAMIIVFSMNYGSLKLYDWFSGVSSSSSPEETTAPTQEIRTQSKQPLLTNEEENNLMFGTATQDKR